MQQLIMTDACRHGSLQQHHGLITPACMLPASLHVFNAMLTTLNPP